MSDLIDIVTEHATALIDLLPKATLRDLLKWQQVHDDTTLALPPTRAKRQLLAELALAQVQARPASLLAFFDAFPETIPTLEANHWPFTMSYEQRHLLTATGHLPVITTRQATLYGRDVDIPAYSALDIFQMAQLGIDGRKALVIKARAEAKQLPAYQAALAQRKQQQLAHRQQRDHLKTEFWQRVTAVQTQVLPAEEDLFMLAFWTQQINQLQKYWQLHATDKRHGLADYYHLKSLAITKFLACDDTHISHGFYRPQNADRYFVSLCAEHFEDYQQTFDYGAPVYVYYQAHRAAIDACPMCRVSITKDYYALYFTRIANANFQFSFHTPYPIGNHLYGAISQYRRVHQEPNASGEFTFGHALDRELLQAVGEQNLLDGFQQALAAFK